MAPSIRPVCMNPDELKTHIIFSMTSMKISSLLFPSDRSVSSTDLKIPVVPFWRPNGALPLTLYSQTSEYLHRKSSSTTVGVTGVGWLKTKDFSSSVDVVWGNPQSRTSSRSS